MPAIKVIKRRISTVGTTKHIMKAMHMVASTKLQKNVARLSTTRPLFEEAKKMMDKVGACEDARDNIFIKQREVKNTAYVVIASNRGLCGGYNVEVSRAALEHMGSEKNEKIIAIGYKGRDYFRRRKKKISHEYPSVSESLIYDSAGQIVDLLVSLYTSGEIDEAYVAYTQFKSALVNVPRVVKVLPVGGDSDDEQKHGEMRYEPDINSFLEHAVPMYLNATICGALAEAAACEQSARMLSMDAATSNADDIIDELTHTYNRIRQAAITQEINEIVSGANMLK